jgi:ribose transport system substrate-binding protein
MPSAIRLPPALFGRVATTVALCLLPGMAAARDCIGVVPAGGGAGFWSDVQAGAERAGRDLDFDIYFRGPKDEEHPELQQRIVEAIVGRGCKALVIAPTAASLADEVNRLKRRGIPTVYIDRDPGGAEVAAVVSTDNLSAGRTAGHLMAQMLHNKGRVLLFRLKAGIDSTDQRETGFAHAATQAGLVVIDGGFLGSDIGQARGRAARKLKTAGAVDGVFTPNESTTAAVLMTLRENGEAGKTRHVGFDSNELLLSAVRQGGIGALIVQRPYDIGYRGVALAVRALKRQSLPSRPIDTGVTIVDAAHLATGAGVR